MTLKYLTGNPVLNVKQCFVINTFLKSIPKHDLNNIDIQKLFTFTQSDKKKLGNKKHFILLNNIGAATIESDISPGIIKESLKFIMK